MPTVENLYEEGPDQVEVKVFDGRFQPGEWVGGQEETVVRYAEEVVRVDETYRPEETGVDDSTSEDETVEDGVSLVEGFEGDPGVVETGVRGSPDERDEVEECHRKEPSPDEPDVDDRLHESTVVE